MLTDFRKPLAHSARWREPGTVRDSNGCDALRDRRLLARGAMLTAVKLKGDADTVAALVGGLLGSQRTPIQVHAELSWNRARC